MDYVERIKGPDGRGFLFQIDKEISGDTMRRALTLARFFVDQFDVLAPQVGGNADLPPVVAKVLELGEQQNTVTTRDLQRRKWASDSKEAKALLCSMVKTYKRGRLIPAPRADQVWWSLQGV